MNQKLLRRKIKASTCKAQKLHVSRKQGRISVPRETAVWEKTLGLKQNAMAVGALQAAGRSAKCRKEPQSKVAMMQR